MNEVDGARYFFVRTNVAWEVLASDGPNRLKVRLCTFTPKSKTRKTTVIRGQIQTIKRSRIERLTEVTWESMWR